MDELMVNLADVFERKAFAELLKVVIGITTKGEIFPLGSWAGTSREEIGKPWKDNEMKFPDGSILICDGEIGLSEAFAEYASEQQRCHLAFESGFISRHVLGWRTQSGFKTDI